MPQATAEELTLLRYPIGGPIKAPSFTAQEREAAIESLRLLPRNLSTAVKGFSHQQLDTPYRPDGWTVRQLIHHVADSHMNAYIRVRLALTEDWPTIVPYKETAWAELPDAKTGAVAPSLELLDGVHQRLVQLFSSLDDQQWKRGYVHPVNGRSSVEQTAVLYDWHSRHHTAHVTQLASRMGW